MLLTGTFVRAVDEKLRIAIPKRLRDALRLPDKADLYVTPGTDGSVAIYTEETLAGLAERLASGSPTGQDVRAFGRLFYAQAERVEVDAQGRVRIPPALAQLASLGKEAVLLGVHDHMELWDRERWETYLAQRVGQYDDIAERAFSGVGPGAARKDHP
jgi:MraZ protein